MGLSSRAHFQQSRACTYSYRDISLPSAGPTSVHSLPSPGRESQGLLPLAPPPHTPLCRREDQGPGKAWPHKVPWERDGYSPPGTTCSTCQRRSGQSRRTAWEKGQQLRSWRPRGRATSSLGSWQPQRSATRNSGIQGQRGGSAVKSPDCFCRGPKFSSWHPHPTLHNYL